MLKRFRDMSRKTLLMLSAVALCALGMGTALALANSGDKDKLNNTGTKITATTKKAVFTAGIFKTECESSGGIDAAVEQELPYTAPVNDPALTFGPCETGTEVKVNCTAPAEITLTLESGNSDRTKDPDPPLDKADENDADTATLRLPSGCSIVIKKSGCTITIAGPQTFAGSAAAEDVSATLDKASLVFTNVSVNFTSTCGLISPGTFTATYAVTPSTLDDLS